MPEAFEHFPKLPTELRFEIWDMCMSVERRVMTVKRCKYGLFRLDGKLPTPLLHVCQESRAQALSYYTQFLRYDARKNLGVACISYAHDSVFIPGDSLTVSRAIACLKPELDKIQSLVVDMDFLPQRLRQKFTGLREVNLLARMPRPPSNSKHVIALKDVRPSEKQPGCNSCEGEVDTSLDTRKWIVYPNLVWKLDTNYLRCWVRKRGYQSGSLQFVRRILVNRLRGHARRGRYPKVDRNCHCPTDLILPVQDPLKPATRSNTRYLRAV